MNKKRKHTKADHIIVRIIKIPLLICALSILIVGFTALFMDKFNFTIPFISDVIVPFMKQFTIEVAVWDVGSKSEVVTAHHLVFFLFLIISIIIVIATVYICGTLQKILVLEKKPKPSKKPHLDNSDSQKNINEEQSKPISEKHKNYGVKTSSDTVSIQNSINDKPDERSTILPPNINSDNSSPLSSKSNKQTSSLEKNIPEIEEAPPVKTSEKTIDEMVEDKFGETPLKDIATLTNDLKNNR